MMLVVCIKSLKRQEPIEANLDKNDLPYIAEMFVLDIIAPIPLMFELILTSSANIALLSNFEILLASLIAVIIFKETIGKRVWLAIVLITISAIILSFEDIRGFSLSFGLLLVLGACVAWGFENNRTRILSGLSR